MEQRLNRVEEKLDSVKDAIAEINVTLAAQHESLKEHMRRTALLEHRMEPVERHVLALNGIVKIIGALSVAVGLIAGIVNLLSKIK